MSVIKVAVLVLYLTLCRVAANEPACSKFSYEVSTLEKMVRTEIAFDHLKAQFEKLRKDVKSAIADMKNTLKKSIDEMQKQSKDMLEDLGEANHTTLVKITEFMEESKAVFENNEMTIERMSGDLRDIYTDMQRNISEQIATPIVGFKATHVTDNSPSAGDVIVFPTVLFNRGYGYRPDDGVFTAPFDGLYIFNVQICMPINNYMTLNIVIARKYFGRLFVNNDNSNSHCNAADAVVYMKSGEETVIKVYSTSGQIYTDSHKLSSFSGALINKGN